MTMNATPEAFAIKVLFDGDCPLCAREIAFMRRRNSRGLAAFEDIAAPGFDAARYGLDQHAVMSRIPVGIVDVLRGEVPPTGIGITRFFIILDAIVLAVLISAVSSTQTTILPTARGTLAMAAYKALPRRFL